ncbi:MAG: hypothetical protein O3C43_20155 [Verrucomicrobia bacterium]|nr:hypothetical protein [Verrucomicrobiota bacterium]
MISSTGLAADSRPTIKMEGEKVELVVDLGGGSISEFRLGPDGLNPLQWDSWSFSPNADESPPMLPRSMGHFLCLDRWGSASEAEKAHGMTNHGEATQVWWAVSHEMESASGKLNVRLKADLPMAGIKAERSISMLKSSQVVLVTEFVTNTNPIGRIYNIVQHPTIGGPFLDESTIVDTNATRGFMQERSMPNPEDPEVRWPISLTKDGTEVDLRFLKNDPSPNVVSFIVEEEYGWVTAISPTTGLLVGYLWKASDYPWVNIWRHVKDGNPFARGLEFGTTGLHKPGHDLVAKGKIFDHSLYRYIDADETQEFSYALFLLEVPEDFKGVADLTYRDGELTLVENKGKERQFKLTAGNLF